MVALEMIVSGVMATLFMDIWQQLLRVVGQKPGNWALVGRWFGHLRHGTVFHRAIADAAPVEGELAIGWIGHYLTGILYGIVFVIVIRWMLDMEPSLMVGLVFGALSSVVPWFFFMPAMGNGVLGANTPSPPRACLMAFLGHSVFGLGLAAGAILIGG